jgi:Protein of unknown function (DUF4239)
MTMYWIYDIPNWQLGLLTTLAFVGISLGGLYATRPFMKRFLDGSGQYNEVVSWFIAAVGVLYGLALGLIAVATYGNYSDADNKASKEAASLAALYRDVDFYSQPLRGELETRLKDYTRFVIEKEWPAHRKGEFLDDGERLLEEFENLVGNYEPTKEREKIAHAEVMSSLNTVVENRGYRVQAVDSGLPAVLWGVVLIGAMLNIAMTYLFWVENVKLHAVLVAALAASIAILVFLTAAMDNPFRGEFSVSPDAYKEVLEKVMTPVPAAKGVSASPVASAPGV